MVFEVASKIEIIQNNNSKKEDSNVLLRDCADLLSKWVPRIEDESDLELHTELWTKLANLALNDESLPMTKLALFCSERALKFSSTIEKNSRVKVSRTRLRWYSIADFLYSRGICRVLQVPALEKIAKEELFLRALKHALEAAKKGYFTQETKMVRDAAKLFESVVRAIRLSECKAEIGPVLAKPIFSLIYYMKMARENSQEGLKQEDIKILTEIVLELIDNIIESNSDFLFI